MDNKKLTLSYSALKTFKTCPMKYYWRYLKNIEPVEKAEALLLGSEVHNYLESFYRNEPYSSISGNSLSSRSSAILEGIIDNYQFIYSDDFNRFEIVKVEKVVYGPIINPKSRRSSRIFSFNGRIDMLIRLKYDMESINAGSLVVVESKTSSVANHNIWNQLIIEDQAILYAKYIENETGEKVKGILFNVIQKPSIKQKKSETENEFFERLRITMANNDLYKRKLIKIDKKRYDDALNNLWQLQRQIRSARKDDIFIKNRNSCFNYFRKCDFYDLCSAEDPEIVIQGSGLFKKRSWDQKHLKKDLPGYKGSATVRRVFKNLSNHGGL